jgi:hypothetical protein
MIDEGWVHGNFAYNVVNECLAPLGVSMGPEPHLRFEQFLYMKMGGCPGNSAYLQSVIRTMNQCSMVFAASLTKGKGVSYNRGHAAKGFQGDAGHHGVASLSAELVVMHSDLCIGDADAGSAPIAELWSEESGSPGAPIWLSLQEARLGWAAMWYSSDPVSPNPKASASNAAAAALAMNASFINKRWTKVQPGPQVTEGQALSDWYYLAFGKTFSGYSAPPNVNPPFASEKKNDGRLLANATDNWQLGVNNVLAFGKLRVSDAVSSATVSKDWSGDKTIGITRRQVAATRVFAMAAAPTNGSMYNAGTIHKSSWAFRYLTFYLAQKAPEVATLALLFFRYDISTPGTTAFFSVWPKQGAGWPDSKYKLPPSLSLESLGGGYGYQSPLGIPDSQGYFPTCQQVWPRPGAANAAASGSWQNTMPDVQASLAVFASEALNWCLEKG